jgi:hypothetical protein
MGYKFTPKNQPIEVRHDKLVTEYVLCRDIAETSTNIETKQYNLGRMSVLEELLVIRGLDRHNPIFPDRDKLDIHTSGIKLNQVDTNK